MEGLKIVKNCDEEIGNCNDSIISSLEKFSTVSIGTERITKSTETNGRRKRTRSDSIIFQIIIAYLAMLAIVSHFVSVDAGTLTGFPLGKRVFEDIGCRGDFDRSIFSRLDRICEDCYQLFREPKLYSMCSKRCYTTEYFSVCLESLFMIDELNKYRMMAKRLSGMKIAF